MVSLLTAHYLILTVLSFMLCACEDVFRAAKGETVHLPFHLPPEDSVVVSVEWTKHTRDSETSCKWIINYNNVSTTTECTPRFTLTINPLTLRIENVQPSDSGIYKCKTTRLIPPPSVDESSSLELQVEGLSLQLLNSSDNNCIHLLCFFESPNPALMNFTWTREGQMPLLPFTSHAMNSELRLCKPDWSDGDTITCHASYSKHQTPYREKITLDFNHEKSRCDFPVVFVALLSIFIISISFIWILFCMFKLLR